jgi:RNA polymerase sigma-70 factor, ECF subfamily
MTPATHRALGGQGPGRGRLGVSEAAAQIGPDPSGGRDLVRAAISDCYRKRQPAPGSQRVYAVTLRHLGRDFEEFYQANYGLTVALVTAVLGNRQDAEDVAQDTFARALARWPRLSSYELPEAWVRQVALRLAVDSGRRLRRAIKTALRLRATLPAEPEPGVSLPFTTLGPALMLLPIREREAIVLHYFVDLPVEQIAHERRIPASTVKARLVSGRRRLERELGQTRERMSDA